MNPFQKTAITTLFAILILVAVGSLVRVSGAGLGCPDWPRCWGCWLPPSSMADIDPAYLAERGLNIEDFNPVKMWIEYTNRLMGLAIGFLVLATCVRSLPYRKTQPIIFWGSLIAVLLVGFEGWLGGQVVKSGLKPGMITLHMVGAVLLLCLLLYITFQAFSNHVFVPIDPSVRNHLTITASLLFGIICLQVFLGTQVREAIDPYIKHDGGLSRNVWLANIGWIDHLHRSFTWLIVVAITFLLYTVKTRNLQGPLRTLSYLATGLIVGQTIFGMALAYGGLPHVFQVLHLVTATLLICSVYALLLVIRQTQTQK